MTKDERVANEIMEVLRRIRMRAAAEGAGVSAELGGSIVYFFLFFCGDGTRCFLHAKV